MRHFKSVISRSGAFHVDLQALANIAAGRPAAHGVSARDAGRA
jgi:hypothetical protein